MFALLIDEFRIPDRSEIGFTNGSHTDVLFKTRIDIAPGIDAGHQDGGIALMMGKRSAGFKAFNQAFHVTVFLQRGIGDLFGNQLGIQK